MNNEIKNIDLFLEKTKFQFSQDQKFVIFIKLIIEISSNNKFKSLSSQNSIYLKFESPTRRQNQDDRG